MLIQLMKVVCALASCGANRGDRMLHYVLGNEPHRPRSTTHSRIVDFLGHVSLCPNPVSDREIKDGALGFGLSQKQLAHILQIDASNLGRWERGEGRRTKKSLETIEAFFLRLNV
jgi:hypothetical protein